MNIQNLLVIQPTPEPRHAGCSVLHKTGVRGCQIAPDGKCSEFVLRVVQPALVGLVDGAICGVATFLGGIFHTLPFLMKDFHLALLAAYAVVGVELILIAWIRYHFMETPFWKSAVQVVLGGLLVLGVGIAFGSA